jgi:hypothetical protein
MAEDNNHAQADDEEFAQFLVEFSSESDRAAVVLGAAKLDLLLYQLLQRFLLPSPSTRDELLDAEGVLGTFSARINAAQRLGLITVSFARDLHLIRKIRNSFAHEITSSSLSLGSHRDRIRELMPPYKNLAKYEDILTAFFGEKRGPGIEFRFAIAVMAIRLEHAFEHCKPLSDQRASSPYPRNQNTSPMAEI